MPGPVLNVWHEWSPLFLAWSWCLRSAHFRGIWGPGRRRSSHSGSQRCKVAELGPAVAVLLLQQPCNSTVLDALCEISRWTRMGILWSNYGYCFYCNAHMMDEVNKAWRGLRSCSWEANFRAKALTLCHGCLSIKLGKEVGGGMNLAPEC